MQIIDADTHVDETEDTWEYLRESELGFKPTTQYPDNPNPNLPPTRYWLIDGRRQLRFIRGDEESGTVVEARELLDVGVRLEHMDRLQTDIQVIYPTLFLMEATERPEVATALRRSYNRWLADRCGRSGGRLRWICVPPLLDMGAALEELRFAKEHGACGVLKKGDREAGKWPADPYFFPLYEEAERLGLPICFHTGSGIPDFSPAREFTLGQFMRTKLAAVHGIESLIVNNVAQRYPRLRFACIEAGASWVPFVDYDVRRRVKANRDRVSVLSGPRTQLSGNLFRDNRIYVACQVDEDLPYLLSYIGEDNLVVGSDYTHRDPSMELEFRKLLQARADRGEIPQSAVRKILYDNPKALYGL
ncbi:MAG TPA: amidohydrolase family protein [candidate division Zixibacteria bacterium]|nr:amidohydrolase family protein [candidate division Zixibacteria bacterium]